MPTHIAAHATTLSLMSSSSTPSSSSDLLQPPGDSHPHGEQRQGGSPVGRRHGRLPADPGRAHGRDILLRLQLRGRHHNYRYDIHSLMYDIFNHRYDIHNHRYHVHNHRHDMIVVTRFYGAGTEKGVWYSAGRASFWAFARLVRDVLADGKGCITARTRTLKAAPLYTLDRAKFPYPLAATGGGGITAGDRKLKGVYDYKHSIIWEISHSLATRRHTAKSSRVDDNKL